MGISLSSSTKLAVRAACPEDAEAISGCYRAAYSPPGKEPPAKTYPFPQFMDPNWVREAVVRDTVCWIVAEAHGEVIGSIGAIRNIGSSDDRIAELFGLVIREPWRRKRIATELFVNVIESLDDACFLIGETRTATAGGWRIVKRQGFIPCGFEPFAHTTPVGSEPMLLLGHIAPGCSACRDVTGHTSVKVGKLAERVLAMCQLKPLLTTWEQSYPLASQPWPQLKAYLRPSHANIDPLKFPMETSCELRITEDATEGRRLQIAWQDNKFHVSGVVCLNRLEGEDPKGERYSEKYFVAHVGSCPIAYSRVVWDRIDRRARILCVHTLFHGLQGLMLNTIVNWLQATSTEQKLTIVVDVRADYPALHYTLEELGFFPTVYYPGLVSGEGGRVDVVQFTCLFGYDFADSLQWTGKVDWSEAKKVTGVVANLASGAVSEL